MVVPADHAHDPGHGHGHLHGHGHGSERRVQTAMAITGAFMVAEAVGGWLAGSLALLADAGHMLTDTAALALAWAAFRAARRPADSRRSYGHHRFQILAAFVNGVTLIGIVALIVVEALHRLLAPVEVLGGTMVVIAGLGLAVNSAVFLILHGGQRTNLNIRGAILHVVGDLLGSVAAIVAAVVILVTGWMPIDPLLSLLVAALILRSALLLVRESAHILMEGTPVGLDVGRLRSALTAGVPGLRDIHHMHVWSLTPERPLLTLHARVDADANDAEVMRGIKGFLARHFGIDHTTIQIERGGCADA